MSAHTAGPWEADTDAEGGGYEITAGRGPDYVVICSRRSWPHRAIESWANARLIAAAPDLLGIAVRARRLLLEICENASYPIPQAWMDAADAAIAKATKA